MVYKRDVLAYLVAVKSIAKYANPYRIVLLSDPWLTAEDKCKLKQHIPHIELRCAKEFVHKGIPTGGCWERLHAISEYNFDDYVVQLNADTVTLHAPAEVLSALHENSGFVLGEEVDQRLMTLNETADRSRMLYRDVQNIQFVVESSIDSVELDGKYYVRRCADFTGFQKSSDMRDKMLAFSKEMTLRHEKSWRK